MIVWKKKDAEVKVGQAKNCCQANKENVWPSYVGGNNSPSSIVWFENVAWVYDLICSIGWKHVYIIYAFYVKKQGSQLLDLTAVVCTTWLRAYRAYKKAYKIAFPVGKNCQSET